MPTDQSGDLRLDPASRPPPRRRGGLGGGLILGAGVALALGLAVGLWARPNFGVIHDTDAAERAAAPMAIEVNKPKPATEADGKLEVLPPDAAPASQHAEYQNAWGSILAELGPPPPLPPARQDPPPRVAELTPPAWTPRAAPAAEATDCTAGGLADQMVCADQGLAEADVEMSRAYQRALRAGISPTALRADQRDWLGIREEAAHHSRWALAQVYRQRIDELNAAAYEDASPESRF
jgi:uncharacterized protein YecT (DUF1311 family)